MLLFSLFTPSPLRPQHVDRRSMYRCALMQGASLRRRAAISEGFILIIPRSVLSDNKTAGKFFRDKNNVKHDKHVVYDITV